MSILPKQVRWKDHVRMKLWACDKKNLPSIMHTIRTAVAATASVMIARLVQLSEAYWAAIATQSCERALATKDELHLLLGITIAGLS
jgi:hypothetical protein